MTITREQAIALAKKHARCWTPQDWVIAAIIEASQPIADVQAEGSYPALPKPTATRIGLDVTTGDTPSLMRRHQITVDGIDVFTADQMRAYADATVAHRQQQAAAKGGE